MKQYLSNAVWDAQMYHDNIFQNTSQISQGKDILGIYICQSSLNSFPNIFNFNGYLLTATISFHWTVLLTTSKI